MLLGHPSISLVGGAHHQHWPGELVLELRAPRLADKQRQLYPCVAFPRTFLDKAGQTRTTNDERVTG